MRNQYDSSGFLRPEFVNTGKVSDSNLAMPFIGHDGRYYWSSKSLDQANKQFAERMYVEIRKPSY